MEDSNYRCVVPFPDGSHSFVHGFEAGMLWVRMEAGEGEITSKHAYHRANEEVIRRMAAAKGYDVEIEYYDDEWMTATFRKCRPRLSVVK